MTDAAYYVPMDFYDWMWIGCAVLFCMFLINLILFTRSIKKKDHDSISKIPPPDITMWEKMQRWGR